MDNQEILKQLKEIEARAARATPGPWKYVDEWYPAGPAIIPEKGPGIISWFHENDLVPLEQHWANAKFVAAARTDVPWLCKLARELLGRLSKLESAAQVALQALTEGMADVPAERDKRCAGLRVKAKRALREALGTAPKGENDGDL